MFATNPDPTLLANASRLATLLVIADSEHKIQNIKTMRRTYRGLCLADAKDLIEAAEVAVNKINSRVFANQRGRAILEIEKMQDSGEIPDPNDPLVAALKDKLVGTDGW